jgi:formiminoglutamate deiminase
LSLHFTEALLPEGWATNVRVVVAKGRVAAVEREIPPAAGDERAGAALPGMCNVHSHGFQRGMAGLTEYRGPAADNFWSWRELMYRFVGRMTPEDIEAITAQAYVEMLEGGFTRVGEFHYVHHDVTGAAYADPAETATRVVAAARDTGIALTLLPVFYAHSGFGGAAPSAGQRRFVCDLDGFERLLSASRKAAAELDDSMVGVAPHSLRAVTPGELAQVVALAGTGPIHIHAAAQVDEVAQCVAWSGARPVEWLLEHASLDSRWCLIHSTHIDAREVAALARSGAVAGLCPITESNLGDGIFPATGYTAARGAYGIGTDSNVSIGVADELRQLEYSQRLRDRARNLVGGPDARSTGRALFDAALRGGAQATGVTPGIEIGAPADFISLDAQSPALASRAGDALIDSFIFTAGKSGIDGVWRGGRRVVTAGRHHARERIAATYRATLARLLDRVS